MLRPAILDTICTEEDGGKIVYNSSPVITEIIAPTDRKANVKMTPRKCIEEII